MKKPKSAIIVTLVALMMGLSGISVIVFGDTSNYDPDKKYRCPGVCKMQQIFDIEQD